MVSSTVTEPGSVLISVEDTGAGVDPAVAQRILDPFFTTKSEGLGRGLSADRLSKAIAAALVAAAARSAWSGSPANGAGQPRSCVQANKLDCTN